MVKITPKVKLTEDIALAVRSTLDHCDYSSLMVLVDHNTHNHCYPLLTDSLPDHSLLEIPDGESHKNLDTCNQIWGHMTDHQMDRKSLVVNLGGGVIGDMGGFCAATFKRGCSFINIPTTLLAQVDASIGGKLGIDFKGYKNHIGMFQEPLQVIISAQFLKTLPNKELRSGFAEVLKHCLISDETYWNAIKKNSWEQQPWLAHIEHSIAVKQKIVTEDPQEAGVRKMLNYGHTIGHAVERFFLSKANSLLHGEAIAIGIIAEAYLSKQKCGLSDAELLEIGEIMLNWFDKVSLNEADFEAISKNALQDKKNSNGHIRCTLLDKIGQATYDVGISREEIKEALQYYQKLIVD